jgi:hypothetical protein
MRRGKRVLAGVAAASAGIAAAAGFALGGGSVGGPPTIEFNRCDRFLRPCDPPIVLGRPRHFVGPVEIIGMHYEGHGGGLCLFIDIPRRGSGHGGCGLGSPLPAGDRWIDQTGSIVIPERRRYISQFNGGLSPDVTRVQARYWRHGKLQHRKAAVVQVDGELLEKIEEPEPFGIFELTVRGCLSQKRVQFLAFNGKGDPPQRARAFTVPGRCRRGVNAPSPVRTAGDEAIRYSTR